jgi:sigma-B regulation protein RsbU (phosphoserine phosphatase)
MSAPIRPLPFPPITAIATTALLGLFLGLFLISECMPKPVLLERLDREANTRLAYDFFHRQTGHVPPPRIMLRTLQVDQTALTTLRQHQPKAHLQRFITQHHLPVIIDHVVWLRPNGSLAAYVSFSPDGEIVGYLNGDVPVSTAEPPAADVALLRARAFLDSNTGLGLSWLGPPQVERVPGQPETEVRWQQPLPELPELTRVVLVRLRGETVWYFQHRLQPTTSGWARPFDSEIIYLLLGPPIQTILLITAAVYLLKTSRRHVILWRVPTVAAVVVGIAWFFVRAPSLPYSIGTALFENPVADSAPDRLAIMTQGSQFVLRGLAGYIISSLVTILLSMAVVWVVCAALLHIEYDTQRPHTEIFRAILLLRRVPYTTILQRGLIGGGVGWFLLGLTGLVQWLLADLFPVAGNVNDNLRRLLDAWSPSLLMVGTLVSNTFDLGLVLVAFAWAALVDWFRWPRWLALLAVSLLGGVGWQDPIALVQPSDFELPWLFLYRAVLALILAVTFDRFGLWATLCVVWVYQATSMAIIAAALPILGISPWLPTLLVGLPFTATALAWRPPESERDIKPEPLSQFLEEQRHIRQLTLATQIQRSFLPTEIPQLESWDIAAISIPAREVGGDFYDFFTSNGDLVLFAGDVSGKSVSGALFTTVAITAFRSEAEENELGCAAMLTRLNELLYSDMKRVRMFVAAVYVRIDLATGSFSVANAGFPAVAWWHTALSDEPQVEFLDLAGLPLGSLRRATYNEYAGQQLCQGEVIILASDGIVEALNERGEPYGYEALQNFINNRLSRNLELQSAQALCAAIISDVRRHMGEAEQADDMTVVIIRRKAP